MEQRMKRRAPPSMKFLSGIRERALPIKGLRMREETLEIPINMPISASAAPRLAR
jgi:hypothetical protein